MPTSTSDIVQRLWNLCHVLRDDGITYHEYVTELTFLLFLKMMKETGAESRLPYGCHWSDLETKTGVEQLTFYRKMLIDLGTRGTGRVQDIFAGASTSLKEPEPRQGDRRHRRAVLVRRARGGLRRSLRGLLEKNANEKKSGAGQYFTPRPLIDCMVEVVKLQAGEIVQDPAAGTAGFLIAADRYIKKHTNPRRARAPGSHRRARLRPPRPHPPGARRGRAGEGQEGAKARSVRGKGRRPEGLGCSRDSMRRARRPAPHQRERERGRE